MAQNRVTSDRSGKNSETIAARWPIAVWAFCLVALPPAVFALAGYYQVPAGGVVCAPFGLERIALAHVLAGLPLSLWVAWHIPGFHTAGGWRRLVAPAASLSVIGLSLLIAPLVHRWVTETPLTRLQTGPVRIGWTLLLQLPMAVGLVNGLSRRGWGRPKFWDLLLGLLLLFLPQLYLTSVMERQSQLVSYQLINQQFQRALDLTRPLLLLGDGRLAGYEHVFELAADLENVLAQLGREVARPLSASASAAERLQRATALYQLGRFKEMEQVLGELVDVYPEASYRMAMAWEVRGQWNEAVRYYRKTLDLLRLRPVDSEPKRALVRSTCERLAQNLRRAGQMQQAEKALREAINAWPSERGALLLQLGLHYRMAGRILEAIDVLNQAATVDVSLRPVVDANLAQLERQAEGCLLRPARAATR